MKLEQLKYLTKQHYPKSEYNNEMYITETILDLTGTDENNEPTTFKGQVFRTTDRFSQEFADKSMQRLLDTLIGQKNKLGIKQTEITITGYEDWNGKEWSN